MNREGIISILVGVALIVGLSIAGALVSGCGPMPEPDEVVQFQTGAVTVEQVPESEPGAKDGMIGIAAGADLLIWTPMGFMPARVYSIIIVLDEKTCFAFFLNEQKFIPNLGDNMSTECKIALGL